MITPRYHVTLSDAPCFLARTRRCHRRAAAGASARAQGAVSGRLAALAARSGGGAAAGGFQFGSCFTSLLFLSLSLSLSPLFAMAYSMEMVENFKEAFALFDKDHKSVIDVPNLGRVMRCVQLEREEDGGRREGRRSFCLCFLSFLFPVPLFRSAFLFSPRAAVGVTGLRHCRAEAGFDLKGG